jgi:hypothetical protein
MCQSTSFLAAKGNHKKLDLSVSVGVGGFFDATHATTAYSSLLSVDGFSDTMLSLPAAHAVTKVKVIFL